MDLDINDYIKIVETRIFNLSIQLRDHLAGVSFDFSIRDIKRAIEINQDMLICLKAARDYGRPVRVYTVVYPEPIRTGRIIRTVFPVGHPYHNRDEEYGEVALA